MTTLSKYGREFEFDDDVPEETQHKRIDAWMRQNAANELEPTGGGAALGAVAGEAMGVPPKPAANKTQTAHDKLADIARSLNNPLLGMFVAGTSPQGKEMLSDKNFYRTLGQGAIPFADEATAGVRSIIPGQPDYSTALNEERQGVKDFGNKYGEDTKIMTELGGAGLSTLATLGAGPAFQAAGRGLPWLGRAGEWMLANPWKSALGTGAISGGTAGFGAGEGGFRPRMASARDNAAIGAVLGPLGYGAVHGAEKLGGWASGDNRVANLLRRKMAERENMVSNQNIPKTSSGDINIDTPQFTQEGMRDLRSDMRNQQRNLKTNPLLADLLPNATEQVLQRPGPQTAQLTRNILKRQYNPKLPDDVADLVSQQGRVGGHYDAAFGQDTFKKSDTELVDQMKGNAKQLFKPAYQHNIVSHEIEDAMDRIKALDPGNNIINQATQRANSKRRSIGFIDRNGEQRNYNTEYLHDIKRSIDKLTEFGQPLSHQQEPLASARTALNNAMKEANPLYKTAMERYGEDAGLVEALKKGRNEIFVPGSVDKTGAMDADAIKSYLANPDNSQAQKDLLRLGAARALRENTIGSTSKKDFHNWADVFSNKATRDRTSALLTDKIGSWNLLKAKLNQESQNYKQVQSAIGNSRTNLRKNLDAEMDDLDIGRIAAGLTNPHAFGSIMTMVNAVKNKVNPGTITAQRGAELLGRPGVRGNASSLRDVEALLRAQDARREAYGFRGAIAPGAAAWTWPYREEKF